MKTAKQLEQHTLDELGRGRWKLCYSKGMEIGHEHHALMVQADRAAKHYENLGYTTEVFKT